MIVRRLFVQTMQFMSNTCFLPGSLEILTLLVLYSYSITLNKENAHVSKHKLYPSNSVNAFIVFNS